MLHQISALLCVNLCCEASKHCSDRLEFGS